MGKWISVEHWLNDTDRGKQRHSERNCFQCHFIHLKIHIHWYQTQASAVRGRLLTIWAMARSNIICYCNYIFHYYKYLPLDLIMSHFNSIHGVLSCVRILVILFFQVKGKGKSVPLQAWTVPEGSRKLRFLDYMTTAQDGGKVVSLTYRPPLAPENTPGTHFC